MKYICCNALVRICEGLINQIVGWRIPSASSMHTKNADENISYIFVGSVNIYFPRVQSGNYFARGRQCELIVLSRMKTWKPLILPRRSSQANQGIAFRLKRRPPTSGLNVGEDELSLRSALHPSWRPPSRKFHQEIRDHENHQENYDEAGAYELAFWRGIIHDARVA